MTGPRFDTPEPGTHNAGVRWLWLTMAAVMLVAPALATGQETPAPPPPPSAAQEYEIGPADVVHVDVMGQPEMTGDFTVDREGLLALPILGKVKASGLSPADLERKLTTLLADGYLKRPQVAVMVQEYRSQRVYLTGEVQRPGVYALKADRSLRSLLGEIGPLGAGAGHEITVIRPATLQVLEGDAQGAPSSDPTEPPPGAEITRLSLREILAGSREFVLRAGDTVHVPPSALVYVTGHVGRQGSFKFQEDLTVLQVLSLAGGVTERGSTKRVKILRPAGGKLIEVKGKLSDRVEPGDTIVVPERFF